MTHDHLSISKHFENINDPRKYNIHHKLIDIITITICAIICGAESFADVEQYGNSKYDWLKEFLQLPAGIPSHDTFGRVFSLIDPKQLNASFACWLQSIQPFLHESQIAIDGKTLRGSHDRANGKSAIHMISALADDSNKSEFDMFETTDGGHGRIEIRRYAASSNIDWLQGKEHRAGLKTIIMVRRERRIDNEISTEISYYISSMEKDAQKIACAIRRHWRIENSLHWILDVSFNEDRCRVRKDHAPENMAILRHIVLNLVKQEKSFKGSVKTKRLKAAWENSYLLKVITA